MAPCTRLTLALVLCLVLLPADARQYKSRLFTDNQQTLSDASAQTIAELEDAFNGYKDDYQIATAGQFLARQLVANQEYDKAVLYYEKTLATEALDPRVQHQLQSEFAQLLLYLKRYPQVLALLVNSELDADRRILLAQASNGVSQYHKAIEYLAPLTSQVAVLSEHQLQQMAGISYQADALPQTIGILSELLARTPNDVTLARQITGLYLRQRDFSNALTIWSLARQKGLLVESQDLMLLADIYHQEGAPEKAARIVQEGLTQQVIAETAANYYRLFQFWYAARESDQAKQSLWHSLELNPDLEKAMILAELLRQEGQWQALFDLLEYTCQAVLPEHYVGKVNLLLGMSYHKLGQPEQARRAFLNTALIRRDKTQAKEWLAFIQAKPATLEESDKLEGLCLPANTSIALPKHSGKNTTHHDTPENTQVQPQISTTTKATTLAQNTTPTLMIKTLPATKFYGNKIRTSAERLGSELKKQTFSLMKNLVKSGGKINGPMHLLFTELSQATELQFVVAFPYSGVPANRGRSRIIREPDTTIVERHFNGPASVLSDQWQQLVADAIAQGLTPTGKARMVLLSDTSGTDSLDVSLQLVIKSQQ